MRDEFGAVEVDFVDLQLASRDHRHETLRNGQQEEDLVLEASLPELHQRVRLGFQRYGSSEKRAAHRTARLRCSDRCGDSIST